MSLIIHNHKQIYGPFNRNYYKSNKVIGFYAANVNYVTFYIDVLKEYEEELNNILELIDLEVN